MVTPDTRILLLATLACGLIILFGGLSALFLALGRLRRDNLMLRYSRYAYLGLVLAAASLIWSLQLRGLWLGLVGLLMLGYFLAPRAIWRLSVATHQLDHTEEEI